ncbi:MAG: hypothetical protein CVV27_14890, partial [Candidatus Melainabacteria bacterium HGW-Melainabacteria-1]
MPKPIFNSMRRPNPFSHSRLIHIALTAPILLTSACSLASPQLNAANSGQRHALTLSRPLDSNSLQLLSNKPATSPGPKPSKSPRPVKTPKPSPSPSSSPSATPTPTP